VRLELNALFGHAIDASQVTAIRYGKSQIIDGSAVVIQQNLSFRTIGNSIVSRIGRTFVFHQFCPIASLVYGRFEIQRARIVEW